MRRLSYHSLWRLSRSHFALIATCCTVIIATGIAPAKVAAAPLTADNRAWNLNASSASNPELYHGEWQGHSYTPSPKRWQGIHFVRAEIGSSGGADESALKRLQSAVPAIARAGFKGLILPPIHQGEENAPPGELPVDLTLIDRRIGTLIELRELVELAHRQGIAVIAELTVNHLGRRYFEEPCKDCPSPFRFHLGEYRMRRDPAFPEYADFTVSNRFYNNGYYPQILDNAGRVIGDGGRRGSFWDSDFNHNGDITQAGDPWQRVLARINGLDPLRLTHPRVQRKIAAMAGSLLASADIDGVLLRNGEQLPLYFLRNFSTALRSHAARLGKDNFLIIADLELDSAFGSALSEQRSGGAGEHPLLNGGRSAAFAKAADGWLRGSAPTAGDLRSLRHLTGMQRRGLIILLSANEESAAQADLKRLAVLEIMQIILAGAPVSSLNMQLESEPSKPALQARRLREQLQGFTPVFSERQWPDSQQQLLLQEYAGSDRGRRLLVLFNASAAAVDTSNAPLRLPKEWSKNGAVTDLLRAGSRYQIEAQGELLLPPIGPFEVLVLAEEDVR